MEEARKLRVENGKLKVGRAARSSFNTTTYFYLDGRGDLWSLVARQKVTFTPTRANTVRPYGRDKDFLFYRIRKFIFNRYDLGPPRTSVPTSKKDNRHCFVC